MFEFSKRLGTATVVVHVSGQSRCGCFTWRMWMQARTASRSGRHYNGRNRRALRNKASHYYMRMLGTVEGSREWLGSRKQALIPNVPLLGPLSANFAPQGLGFQRPCLITSCE